MIRHRQRPTERELAALADGSLPAAKRMRVERAVAASPELQALVAAQRRALTAIDQAADQRAPAALRARLALMERPRRGGQVAPARSSLRRARMLSLGAVAAAVVAAVLVVSLGGGVSAPTVADAAVLATRPAMAPVPSGATNQPTVGVRAAGLAFPYWGDQFGFRAVGVRHDRLDGRATTTVFYERGGERVAYTIVAGEPLSFGAHTQGSVWNGVRVWSLSAHGMRVATWLRHDHSCVLAGRNVPLTVLVSLASWRGDGRVSS